MVDALLNCWKLSDFMRMVITLVVGLALAWVASLSVVNIGTAAPKAETRTLYNYGSR